MTATLAFRNMTFRRVLNQNLVFQGFSTEFDRFPLAVLGPNGAGKSTLFGLASGILKPGSGNVRVNGRSTRSLAGRQAARRLVGLVPQHGTGLAGLNVREALAYTGWLKGMTKRDAWSRSLQLIDRLNLGDVARRGSTRLSGGQQRRLSIAQGLIADPALLLLDEATTGLDPLERQNLVGLVRELAAERPVIAATHEVDDLAEVFEYVCVLDGGEVHFMGTIDEFLGLSSLPRNAQVTPRQRAEDAYAICLGLSRS